jgi:hypothetical protein
MIPHRRNPAIPKMTPTTPTPAARPSSQPMRVSAATARSASASVRKLSEKSNRSSVSLWRLKSASCPFAVSESSLSSVL